MDLALEVLGLVSNELDILLELLFDDLELGGLLDVLVDIFKSGFYKARHFSPAICKIAVQLEVG